MPKQPKNTDVKKNADLKAQKIASKRAKKTVSKDSNTTGTSKKPGNPSLYLEKIYPYLSDIGRYIRCGVTEGQLASYYNVGKTSWAKYKKEYPEMNETVNKAKTEFKTEIVSKAYEVAMGYEYTESTTVDLFDNDGKKVGTKTTTYKKYAKADAGMLQFLLINRIPDEFARDPQILELRKKALELAEKGQMAPEMEGI